MAPWDLAGRPLVWQEWVMAAMRAEAASGAERDRWNQYRRGWRHN